MPQSRIENRDEAHRAPPPLLQPTGAGGSHRVLLAGSDTAMREFLALTFQQQGYTVCDVANGFDALTMLLYEAVPARDSVHPRFDMVVLCEPLPGVTGLEILEYLRIDDHDLPVILITETADAAAREQACRLGATGVLATPFSLTDLLRLLEVSRSSWAPAPTW